MPLRPRVCSGSFFTEADVQSNETDSVISSFFYTLGSVDPKPCHPGVPDELAQIKQNVVFISLLLRHGNN